MPRTKKILNAEEAEEKVLRRKQVVAKYTAKSHSKELASVRHQRYKNDPNSTYHEPREGDARERQKRDQKKYYQKKKEERRIAEEAAEAARIANEVELALVAEEARVAEQKRIKRERNDEISRILYAQEMESAASTKAALDKRIAKLAENPGYVERGPYGEFRTQSAKTRELVAIARLRKQRRLPSILSFMK